MTNRKVKKSLSKENMFNKIMPSYADEQVRHAALKDGYNKKSDTFRLSENTFAEKKQYTAPENQPTPQTLGDVISGTRPAIKNTTSVREFFAGTTTDNIEEELHKDIVGSSESEQKETKKESVQDVASKAEDDRPHFLNMTKQVLYSKLDEMMDMFNCCNCDLCRQAVTLQVLNSVKPEYKYVKRSEMHDIVENSNHDDINQPIIHAIFEVKANPPHTFNKQS